MSLEYLQAQRKKLTQKNFSIEISLPEKAQKKENDGFLENSAGQPENAQICKSTWDGEATWAPLDALERLGEANQSICEKMKTNQEPGLTRVLNSIVFRSNTERRFNFLRNKGKLCYKDLRSTTTVNNFYVSPTAAAH